MQFARQARKSCSARRRIHRIPAHREGHGPALAPDIVEAVIDGRQGHAMTVRTLTKPFPVEWAAQRHGRRT
jgi:hypothetical protein